MDGLLVEIVEQTHILDSIAENSDGQVEFLDLTIDAFNLPAFDWILSLEVAEHIPAEFERYMSLDTKLIRLSL